MSNPRDRFSIEAREKGERIALTIALFLMAFGFALAIAGWLMGGLPDDKPKWTERAVTISPQAPN